jgi:hypothetical protein
MQNCLIYLSIYFCLTCFGLSFNPSSEVGVQLRQWLKSSVNARALTPYPVLRLVSWWRISGFAERLRASQEGIFSVELGLETKINFKWLVNIYGVWEYGLDSCEPHSFHSPAVAKMAVNIRVP